MKIGERFAVQMEGMDVAEAVIENIEDGLATLVIPATRIQVKIKQDLDFAATREPEVDRILAGQVEGDQRPAPAPAPVETKTTQTDIGEGIHGQQLDSSALD